MIVLPGKPVPKGRPRFNRAGRAYTDATTRSYEASLAWVAKVTMASRKPFLGPLEVRISVCLPVPKSWSKKDRELALAGAIRPTSGGDWDNYAKAGCDSLNSIVWRDDSQIVNASVKKIYAVSPRLEIEVKEV